MYVKRNVKMNPQVIKTVGKTSIANSIIVGKCPRKFKSNGLGKYKFPKCDEVPAGNYFSKITAVNHTITKSGKEAVEVFYEIKEGTTCYKIANGILPDDAENKPYYIKQVYPEGAQYYDKFVDSVAEALDKDDFGYDDIVGVTEYITLSYDKSDIGGFSDRTPLDWDDFIEVEQNDQDDYDY